MVNFQIEKSKNLPLSTLFGNRAFSIPAIILLKKLFCRNGRSTPTNELLRVTSDRAAAFGVYPIRRAVSQIRFRISGESRPRLFNAVETAIVETPIAAAISFKVTAFPLFIPKSPTPDLCALSLKHPQKL